MRFKLRLKTRETARGGAKNVRLANASDALTRMRTQHVLRVRTDAARSISPRICVHCFKMKASERTIFKRVTASRGRWNEKREK